MLGWDISVHVMEAPARRRPWVRTPRPTLEETTELVRRSFPGEGSEGYGAALERLRGARRIAEWSAGWTGLDWVEALTPVRASLIWGHGYPMLFLVRARDVPGVLTREDVKTGGLDPNQWLLVEAWDQS